MIQATDRFCNLARDCGIAGLESNLYQVQGLGEDENLRGFAQDEGL
jgi:hypothetical protein